MPTINKKLSAVMLGYGYWGRNVAKALQNSSDFELKAIFDLDKSQQDAANTAHHLSTTYKDIQSILEDDSIHSIFIITPPLLLHLLRHFFRKTRQICRYQATCRK